MACFSRNDNKLKSQLTAWNIKWSNTFIWRKLKLFHDILINTNNLAISVHTSMLVFFTILQHFRSFWIFLKIMGLIYVTAVDARAVKSLVPRITYETKGPPEGTKRRRWWSAEYKAHLASAEHSRRLHIYVSIDIWFRLLSTDSSLSSALSRLILFVSSAPFSQRRPRR